MEQGTSAPEVARILCGHLARFSTYTTELSLQATDEDGLLAIAFAWLPGDTNDADEWLRKQLSAMTEDARQRLLINEQYLKRIEEELQSKMLSNSAKLSFFISRKPGFGTPVQETLIDLLRNRGVEWLYLWTECTCKWLYYSKHGYEQIGQGIAPEFNPVDKDYIYHMFRKRIV